MSIKRFGLAMLATATLCPWTWVAAAPAAAVGRPPVAAFATVPAMTDVVLSPNGQRLAWIDNSGTRPTVEVFDVPSNSRWLRFAPEQLKLRGIEWADDDVLLIHNSITRATRLSNGAMSKPYEWDRISAMNVRTRKSVFLLQDREEFAYVSSSDLLAPRTGTPGKVVMASWYWSETNHRQETGSRLAGGRKDAGWTYNVYEVDTATGGSRPLGAGSPYTWRWIVDDKGQPIARVEWEPERKRYSILHRRGQGWAEIFLLETGERPMVSGVTEDGSALLMFGALTRSHSALWRVPLDGSAPQTLLDDEKSEISVPVLDPYTRQVQGVWMEGIQPEIRWIDEKAGQKAAALRKTFGGAHAHVIGRSADGSRVLVDVSTASKPSTFYLVDYRRGTADIVGEEYPALATAALGEFQAITYQARDRYEIPAYLTLPAGVEAKQLPLIVLPHGGPQGRDVPGFNWLTQFLTSRGYAVLQPQFRGSTGFGEAHAQAGHQQWGMLMQDDVTDGVKAMVERGIADPKRICIAGASYGGYAALAGATFTSDLYACAISINGVSDLPIMLGHVEFIAGEESNAVASWGQHIGSRTDPHVIAKSPARAAELIRAPILLLHGSDDTVVPPEQTRVMIRALKAKGKPHKFVELPGEDHWLYRSDSRIRVLTEIETFLAEHLAPKEGG